MAYQSKTDQFGSAELARIEGTSAPALARALINSSPVIALRAVAEVMLNDDSPKLHLLLMITPLTSFWRRYKEDEGVDERDEEYAKKLEERLLTNV